MKKIENGLWQVIDWFLFIGTLAMVLLIFINVVGRYVFNFTFVSFEEISRILFVWGTYLGSTVAIKESSHIRVDIIINMISPMAKKIVDIIANLLMDFIMVITIKAMMTLVMVNIANPLPLTRIPYGVVQGIIPLSLLLMLIVNLVKLVELIKLRPEKKGGETV
ncbi:TRAP transporter small permease [Oscillibacter sp.]|uniref:TRAP transporter small permease n=1 Tax=Oscillibacter sp. TaxID=1945593 RepID=UPI00260439A4|nr:TRAP transporter small permease [Oscillibacter sp.]MDD3347648.1 TRAP transporter small permease [Oscillibacter sp.]